LINYWFVPNALLVIAVLPFVITLACIEFSTAFAEIVALLVSLRCFPVTMVYMFKLTLSFKVKEDLRLKQRYLSATERGRRFDETQL